MATRRTASEMCIRDRGLSEQGANVRYNTLTSALDAVLLVLLLPRWGLGGYIFAFAATHLLNFTLSLRRLLIVTGCPLRLGAALGVGADVYKRQQRPR